MSEHLTHHEAGVRAIIEREVAKERERVAQAIEAACVKAEALTQDVMGQRSQHWRGPESLCGEVGSTTTDKTAVTCGWCRVKSSGAA